MPTTCKRCQFFTPFQNGFVIIGPLGHCDRLGKEVFYLENRLEDCPLIHIPDHGRLIDADTIGLTNFEIILCKQEQEPYKEALKMILDKIEKSPTIIPKD